MRPAIPWHVSCLAAAGFSTMFGAYWDISWHMSIGRDTFWTPAHMAIYLGGILAAISCGYAILHTTFGNSAAAKASAVRVLGFRGPIGCFIAAWGGIAMLTSAPFDNWWHEAYGLDVKIISLPHSLLAIGVGAINTGALLLASSEVNRASAERKRTLDLLMLCVAAVEVGQIALFNLENTHVGRMHSSSFYLAVSLGFPVLLIAISRVSDERWPATIATGIYTVMWLLGLWIFPLFPAAPKLGPVYQNVTHFIPLWFPILLIAPAIALDLLRMQLGEKWGTLRSAALAGIVFLAAMLAAQWPFANFLMSPAARNAIFGRIYFPFSDPANLTYDPYTFWKSEPQNELIRGLIMAAIAAVLTAMLGMLFGNWLRRVKR